MTDDDHAPGLPALLPTVALGTVTGVLAGTLGIGGGALAVVGLVALGFRQHAAHATSLAAIVATASAALVPFALAGEVSLWAAAVLAVTAMAGAFLGADLMRLIPERGLRFAFVVFILVIAARMFVGAETMGAPAALGPLEYVGLGVLGVVTGVLSSIMGVGGGIVLVPALVLMFGFGQHAAEGTSLAVIVPTAMVGALRHTRSGYTSWRTGAVLGACGVVGGLVGARLALGMEDLTLQRLFASFLVVMAVWLLVRGWRDDRKARTVTPG